jgi:hypothetical protein
MEHSKREIEGGDDKFCEFSCERNISELTLFGVQLFCFFGLEGGGGTAEAALAFCSN